MAENRSGIWPTFHYLKKGQLIFHESAFLGSNDKPIGISEREVSPDVEIPSWLEIDVAAVGGKEICVSHIGDIVDAAEELQATATNIKTLGIERQVEAIIALGGLLALGNHAFLLGPSSHH